MLKQRPKRNLFRHCHCNFAFNSQCLFLHQNLAPMSTASIIITSQRLLMPTERLKNKTKKTYIPVASRLTINLGFICVYLNLTTAKMLPFLIPQVSACACICGGSASGRRYSRGMMPWSASCSRVLLCWSLSCRTEVGGGWGWGKRMKSKEMTGESKDKKREMKGKDEKVWKHRWGSDNRGRKRLRIHATQNVVRVQWLNLTSPTGSDSLQHCFV